MARPPGVPWLDAEERDPVKCAKISRNAKGLRRFEKCYKLYTFINFTVELSELTDFALATFIGHRNHCLVYQSLPEVSIWRNIELRSVPLSIPGQSCCGNHWSITVHIRSSLQVQTRSCLPQEGGCHVQDPCAVYSEHGQGMSRSNCWRMLAL